MVAVEYTVPEAEVAKAVAFVPPNKFVESRKSVASPPTLAVFDPKTPIAITKILLVLFKSVIVAVEVVATKLVEVVVKFGVVVDVTI